MLLNSAWMCLHVLLHGMIADVVCESLFYTSMQSVISKRVRLTELYIF